MPPPPGEVGERSEPGRGAARSPDVYKRQLETFATRPYLWSTHVWNMFDFAADARDEGGVQGRNNKGLVTYDRKTKKDSFYACKAWWSDEAFVLSLIHIWICMLSESVLRLVRIIHTKGKIMMREPAMRKKYVNPLPIARERRRDAS